MASLGLLDSVWCQVSARSFSKPTSTEAHTHHYYSPCPNLFTATIVLQDELVEKFSSQKAFVLSKSLRFIFLVPDCYNYYGLIHQSWRRRGFFHVELAVLWLGSAVGFSN